MTSVAFPGLPGHAVLFHGEKRGKLIFADPYGDPWSGYSSHEGYAVEMNKDQFRQHVKALGENLKWGHVPL